MSRNYGSRPRPPATSCGVPNLLSSEQIRRRTIPFSGAKIDTIVSSVEVFAFDRICGHFVGVLNAGDAEVAVRLSAGHPAPSVQLG